MHKQNNQIEYTDEQLSILLEQGGDAVVRMSVLRLIESLEVEQVTALNHYLEQNLPIEAKLLHMFENYPQFANIVNSEIKLQQKRVAAIMNE